jgi:hypothetical protein
METLIALALVGLVITKLTLVMDEARRAHEDESAAMQLEDQAMVLLDKIAFAIVGASARRLDPTPESPNCSPNIHFQISLGVEDGEAVWSDPELIGLEEENGQVYWGQNVGTEQERIVVWANTVSEMLQDELLNGVDDNGNQLLDELGLAFVTDERGVTIRLTLERTQENGQTRQVTRETTVTCRN